MARFRVVFSRHQARNTEQTFVLERDLWDDNGYVCTFRVFAQLQAKLVKIGDWKILDGSKRGPRQTEPPLAFDQLPASYLSVAQSVRAYESVRALPKPLARQLLAGLRDVSISPEADPRRVDGFEQAALRFSEARDAFRQGLSVLANRGPQRLSDTIDLRVTARLAGFATPHRLDLSFSSAKSLSSLRRITVIVGSNGTGKTQLLGALARAMSGLETSDARIKPESPFTKVIAVAYGAFDRFKRPRKADGPISYEYCGLRGAPLDDKPERVSIDLEAAIMRTAQTMKGMQPASRRLWARAVAELDLTLKPSPAASVSRLLTSLKTMSAGEQLATIVVTDLVNQLQRTSLVLFDEPETHLHPKLLAGLMRAMRLLLEERDSYAIVATHALLPLQESLTDGVIVFDRFGDSVHARRPEIECFGASLDEIQREVFGLGERDRNFQLQLRRPGTARALQEVASKTKRPSLGLRLALASVRAR
jgi:predicted ATPase